MDAVIKQAVREELRRHLNDPNPPTATSSSNDHNNSTDPRPNNGRQGRMLNRMSDLVHRIRSRSQSSTSSGSKIKKRKMERVKEHRIQVRWSHWNKAKCEFMPVKQKNGGGNRYIVYTDPPSLLLGELKQKAIDLFFPSGKNKYGGSADILSFTLCDATQAPVHEFPWDGTLNDYLKENGLYASTTYFYLRSKQKDISEYANGNVNDSDSQSESANNRVICDVCKCTYEEGDTCIRCEQNTEYEQSLIADHMSATVCKGQPNEMDTQGNEQQLIAVDSSSTSHEEHIPLTLEEMRRQRVAYLSLSGNLEEENCDSTAEATELADTTQVHNENRNQEQPENGESTCMELTDKKQTTKILTVHRTLVKKDMIEYFKSHDIMNKELIFEIINERGTLEQGVGIGVTREVYTLFWNEFANSMTIGERERVPFVRHDHFVEEWNAIGRILVKGFESVSYFPLFISKAFLGYCLFGNQIPDMVFLESFQKYLSKEEEEMIKAVIENNSFPEDKDEFDDFLERFQCRSFVKEENLYRIILEIAKQELIQKPHLMISSWESVITSLKAHPSFQSLAALGAFYDKLKPTNKKVLDSFVSLPSTDGERDAFKFLQRFVRGLDETKLLQFLCFTTGMDVMQEKKIEVMYTKNEGLGSRPIAHTCGPVLEIPSTYPNFVELREEFTNILNKNNWEIDIV